MQFSQRQPTSLARVRAVGVGTNAHVAQRISMRMRLCSSKQAASILHRHFVQCVSNLDSVSAHAIPLPLRSI